jgi:diguanylate cyclase (GGDEF)-like protein
MSTAGPDRADTDTGGIESLEVVARGDLPGAVSWARASRRSRFRLLVPFILLCLLAVALATVPDTDVDRASWLWAAAGLLVLSGFQIVLMPWHRLHTLWRHAPAVTFCLGVVLLREVDASGSTGFGVLLLLPIIWQAVYGRRIDLALAFAQMLAALAIPVLVFDGYPVRQEVPRTILLLAVAAALGVVLRTLIATVRSHDRTMQTVVAVSRLLHTTDDPVGVLGAGIRTITQAHSVVLYQARSPGEDRVRATAVVERGAAPGASTVRRVTDDGDLPPLPDRAIEPELRDGDVLFERRPAGVDGSSPTWPAGVVARLLAPIGPYRAPVGMAEAHWHRHPRRPSAFDRTAMGLLGIDAGRALERVDLIEVLDDQAHRDGLTALPNRRAWDELIGHEIASARRLRRALSVAVIDLDHFKHYNDHHGHLAGDDLLREAAAAWSEGLRGPDILARWGGEEFVVVLPGTDLREAVIVVERMQFLTPGGQTFSAGVAALLDTDTADSVVAAADAAMYQAKAAGRNRVVAAVRRQANGTTAAGRRLSP